MATLDQLAELVGGKSIGQSDLHVSGVSEIQNGKQGTISFLANLKYKKYLESILAKGSEDASYRARKTVTKVYRKVGFIPK